MTFEEKMILCRTEYNLHEIFNRINVKSIKGKTHKYKMSLNPENNEEVLFSIDDIILDVYNTKNKWVLKKFMDNVPYFLKRANKLLKHNTKKL